MDYSAYLVPLLLMGTALYALGKRVNVYEALTKGAEEGLTILIHILPPLVGLMTAVYMLRASGAMEAAGQVLSPVLVPRLHHRPDGGGDAGEHGDNLLHHRSVLRLRRGAENPVRRSGGADCGPGRIYGGGLRGEAVLRGMRLLSIQEAGIIPSK